jgi:hypothetical protein
MVGTAGEWMELPGRLLNGLEIRNNQFKTTADPVEYA